MDSVASVSLANTGAECLQLEGAAASFAATHLEEVNAAEAAALQTAPPEHPAHSRAETEGGALPSFLWFPFCSSPSVGLPQGPKQHPPYAAEPPLAGLLPQYSR